MICRAGISTRAPARSASTRRTTLSSASCRTRCAGSCLTISPRSLRQFPFATLPPSPLLKPGADPAQLLGLSSTGGLSQADLLNLLKLEAPLAVQARPPHAGFFPLNKFSTVPLLMKAARTAAADSHGNDATKEFMVLPDTHAALLAHDTHGRGHLADYRRGYQQRLYRIGPGRRGRHRAGHDRERASRVGVLRRNRTAHLAPYRKEPDRPLAFERCDPRAAHGDPGPFGGCQRGANGGASSSNAAVPAQTAICSDVFTCRSRRPAAAARLAQRMNCSGRSPTSTSLTSCGRRPTRMSRLPFAASARWSRLIRPT